MIRNIIQKEFRIFLTAILFYTRIPCPSWVDHSDEFLKASSRYLPLIGVLVGGLSGLLFFVFHYIFDASISILLSMAFSILLTGAFHEDGLADMCDGFGGGWTKEKILLIMKDSRIGSFGAIGLFTILALKFTSLRQISGNLLIPTLIAGNAISRLVALTYLYTHSYARDSPQELGEIDDSKIRPLSTKINLPVLCMASLFGIFPLFFLHHWAIFAVIPLLGLVQFLLGRMFTKWIGGYTGDCLGGAQQIGEVVFYLGCLVVFRFTPYF